MVENKLKNVSDDELVYISGMTDGSRSAPAAQAELMRRLTHALRESHQSTEKYSEKMLNLSLVLLLVALVQVGVSVFSLQMPVWAQILVAVVLLAFIFYEAIKMLSGK